MWVGIDNKHKIQFTLRWNKLALRRKPKNLHA